MTEKPATFDDLLATCQHSAFHLEMRDGYTTKDEAYASWRAGNRLDPADRNSWWRPWLDLIKDTVGRGVRVHRARIVSEPVSEYIRYEYDETFTNIAAGEEVRWLPRRQASDLALPGNDFWLFDDRVVLFNHFAGNGDWGCEPAEEMNVDPAVVRLCSSAFDAVWERAIPHGEYRPA